MNPILNVQNGMLRRNLIYSKKNKKSRGKKKRKFVGFKPSAPISQKA